MFIGLCDCIVITGIVFEVEPMSNLRPLCALIIQCNLAKAEEEIGSISVMSNDVRGLDVDIITNPLIIKSKIITYTLLSEKINIKTRMRDKK